ncbi:MAG TPA: hypothetical protein DCX06_06580 [Opitutae bacterium]|nr:hypothetical protein [Opitutae bacterium]
MNFGYTTNGKLYLAAGSAQPAEIKSEFAEQVIQRHRKAAEKGAWKSESDGKSAGFDIWGKQASVGAEAYVKIKSVVPVIGKKDLFYTLQTESVGGLFRYDLVEKEESRIFHKEGVDIQDLCMGSDGQMLCAARDGMSSSIALLSTSRFKLDFITEGDAQDIAPSWTNIADEFVFQSSGIGRNQDGHIVTLGNATIDKVNLSNGAQETLLDDARYDFLSPKVDSAGNLYCIRRPYSASGNYASHFEMLKDFVMMPFRLLKALFGFLDVMSRIFGKQTLSNASTGAAKDVDMKEAYIKGAYVKLSKADQRQEDASVIPSDWELIRMASDGSIEVIESKVLDFEITSDDEIVYTNGFSVRIREEGKSRAIFKGKEIIDDVFIY